MRCLTFRLSLLGAMLLLVSYSADAQDGAKSNASAGNDSKPAATGATDSLIEQAQKAIEAGNHEQVVSLCTKAIAQDPNNWSAYFLLGTAYNDLSKYDESVVALRKAVELLTARGSMAPQVYVNLGNSLLEQKKYDDAISQYEKVLPYAQKLPNLHFNFARALFEKDRFYETIYRMDRAERLGFSLPLLYLQRGRAYLAIGMKEAALADFDRFILKVPETQRADVKAQLLVSIPRTPTTPSADTASIVAVIAARENVPEENVLFREIALAQAKASGKAEDIEMETSNLAGAYTSSKQYDKAKSLWEALIAQHEKTADKSPQDLALAVQGLGELYYRTNEPEKAEPLLRRAVELYQKAKMDVLTGPAMKEHALILQKLGRKAEAEEETARADKLLTLPGWDPQSAPPSPSGK